MRGRRGTRGHTVLELLGALAIMLILSTLALPAFGQLIRQQRLRCTVNELFEALRLARSLAVTRNAQVVLAPLNGSDWRSGWAVAVGRDGASALDADAELILTHGPVPADVTIGSNFGAEHGRDYVAYNGEGRSCSATNSAAARFGTLSLFQDRQTRRIKVNMLGQARMCDPEHGAGDCSGASEAP